MKHILVIGGGAAGMAAAITAARENPAVRVTIVERMDRVGKKILATGNGRCNLTNMGASFAHFYSSDKGALKRALEGMAPEIVLNFFASLGLLCQEEDEGRVYPYCKQASMVLDVLLQALKRLNIQVHCGSSVAEIARNKGRYTVKTSDGQTLTADAVILTCGGKAAPKLGSDGSGYALAKAMGHSCTALYPALVAFKCDMNGLGGLKGIRAEGGLTLLAGDHVLGKEVGELQFTEYGLSGIPAMQLSGRLSRLRKGEKCIALVDLFPHWEHEALFRDLKARQKTQETLETLLLGTVHKRLAYAVLKSAGRSWRYNLLLDFFLDLLLNHHRFRHIRSLFWHFAIYRFVEAHHLCTGLDAKRTNIAQTTVAVRLQLVACLKDKTIDAHRRLHLGEPLCP